MNDLPTRATIRNRWRRFEEPTEAGMVLDAYAFKDLLTREEAANDPKVQEMIAQFILKASGWDDRR